MLILSASANAQDWNQQAVALQARQDWNGLRELAQRWSVAEPQNPGGWTNLGLADDRLAQPEAAVEAYERAFSLQPQSMVWMYLAQDYHTLGRKDALRRLRDRLQQSNPAYAGMLVSQYAADFAASSPSGATPLPPSHLPLLASQVMASARQWRADAVLTAVGVQNYSQYSYAVAVGNAYMISFTIVSKASREVLSTSYSLATYQDSVSALADNTISTPLPDNFVDLPTALRRAEAVGMQGPMDHALLGAWRMPKGEGVVAWIITDRRSNTVAIDALSGKDYRMEDVFGPVPGNDAELRDALAKAKEALAQPPPPTATPQLPSRQTRCIPCEIHAGQARQYIVNHPTASFGEALAATSH